MESNNRMCEMLEIYLYIYHKTTESHTIISYAKLLAIPIELECKMHESKLIKCVNKHLVRYRMVFMVRSTQEA